MKKNIYKLAVFGAAMFVLNACNLDYNNPNEVTGDEELQDATVLESMVNQCYTPLIYQIYQSSDYIMLTEAGTDIWEEPKNGSSYKKYHYYDGLVPTKDSYLQKIWNYGYNTIGICNSVVDRVETANITETQALQFAAQARCLRAYYYSILVEQFGNVTLNLAGAGSGVVDVNPQRSSVEAIYAQIVEDLKYAVTNLPKSFDNYARVTKKTAMGLLCRAYIQGSGYDLQEDGVSYLQKAYDTATEFITNKAIYGAELYDDFADVFNEKNNRKNKEFLFAATGANKSSDAWSTTNGNIQVEAFRHFLPSLGNYTDLGLVDKTNNFVYGRPNSNVFLPSKYLMDCFSDDLNDTRYRYSFISAYSAWNYDDALLLSWGMNPDDGYNYETIAKKLTPALLAKYGIDSKWENAKLHPHFVLIDNGTDKLGVWNIDGTAYTLQANTEGNILHPALPLDPSVAHQYSVYCSLKTLSDAEKAEYPCFVNNVYDLYDENGTARATDPGATTSNKVSIYPALSKFNMPGEEFFGNNAQRKTNDMPIMRFAEVYLIAAEAAVRLGKTDAATYIKPLRDRAGVTTPSSITDMNYIYDEYARELCGEYSRWYLLKRNHAFETRLAKYNKRAIENFKSTSYLRPVPQEFLDAIYNADEFGQNPGY